MPADEVTHEVDADASRVRTGPRHAAPKKPLFTRFHMPAGRAIASVAMPTAVLMGMGFTASLAMADNNPSSAQSSELADEYQDCVAALDGGGQDASTTPEPSASAGTSGAEAGPGAQDSAQQTPSSDSGSGGASSPDSGSGDSAQPTPTATSSSSPTSEGSGSGSTGTGTDTAKTAETATVAPTPAPSPSETDKGLLEALGDAISGVFTGGGGGTEASSPEPTATPTPTASAATGSGGATDTAGSGTEGGGATSGSSGASGATGKTAGKVTDTVRDAAQGTTQKAAETTPGTTEAPAVAASPSPSASSTPVPADCEAATDALSGVDNKILVADDPWYLDASSLLLKGADYQGIVEVRTANGTTKKVLKYVINNGTDIGDLHQTVKDKQSGKTYHVQASKGSTSTIRQGSTVMYTQSISGNLFGLIPITFSPDNPPPLNIPLIYFTHVKVVQAAQFGGTLTVPGMHVYTTD
ncbi:hypothetical protein JS756_27545 [Streptomyces actuosus]|uniref:Membrane-bound hydrophilic protein n=1 Tax=Streptomyces actuosus TaxID=1885 RepID=A0ABS2VXN0_STRAS|nr:hypothetical protein [Streptomyces actuosus]MBN0047798.1 hypothetical protein [Streptomyces actuosus]